MDGEPIVEGKPLYERVVDELIDLAVRRWPKAGVDISAEPVSDREFDIRYRFPDLKRVEDLPSDIYREALTATLELNRIAMRFLSSERDSVVVRDSPGFSYHTDHRAPRFSHFNGTSWVFRVRLKEPR